MHLQATTPQGSQDGRLIVYRRPKVQVQKWDVKTLINPESLKKSQT